MDSVLEADGEGDAGDGGVVVEEVDVGKGGRGGGEKSAEGLALAETDLHCEEAAGAQSSVGFGDEATVDVEAGVAGEEGGMGFVVQDFGG